jgi:Flp pilus assembly protein TadD
MGMTNSQTAREAGNAATLQAVCVCFLLVLAVLVVFGQTAHFGFVNYDDPLYVYENAQLSSGVSLKGVAYAFTHVECSLYHPLTMISLRLDYQLHGPNAGGYHLANVLIHAASAVLLFLVMRRMTGALWRSAFLAAVFAIHPLRAESVAWVTERKDVLGAFFFMLTLGAYVRYVEMRKAESRKQELFYALTLVFFVLGLLSKPTAVVLPFVLLLLDYWPLNRFPAGTSSRAAGIPKRLILEKIPLLALAAAACVVTVIAAGEGVSTANRIPMPMRICNAVVSYLVYLRQMFWPAGLAVFYPYPAKSPSLWEMAAAILLLAVISGGVLMLRRKRPWLLVGWFWYLGVLVPVIGVVQAGDFAHADRNSYLSQIGLCVALIWEAAGVSAVWRCRRAVVGGCSAAILAALTYCAHAQASFWRDSESLWNHALSCTTGNDVAHYNLGNDLVKHGRDDDAIVQFQEALATQPVNYDVHYNLANALLRRGRLDEAIAQYRDCLEIAPDNADVLNNLGNALAGKGADAAAIAQYQKSLAIKPGQVNVLNNLAWLLATTPGTALRNGAKAVALATQASQLSGEANPVILHTLAAAYAEAGMYGEATATARRALELARAQQNSALAATLQKEMELYEAETPPATAPQ